MLTEEEAKRIADAYVADQVAEVPLGLYPLEAIDGGWTFFYQSKDYMETGDFESQLVGHGAIIICGETGKLYETGSAYPIDHWISEWKSGRLEPLAKSYLVP